MKSYLSLIQISEKKHKKQSRMTRLCIVLAVFLVTSIFSMADMEMRSQKRQTIRDNGYWHLSIRNISEVDAVKLREMDCVDFACDYGAANNHLNEGYTVDGKGTILCGFNESFKKVYEDIKIEGNIPVLSNEASISRNMASELQKSIGDSVKLSMKDGTEKEFIVKGIIDNTATLTANDCYGMNFSVDTFKDITKTDQNSITYYVKIKDNYDIRRGIDEIKEKFSSTDAVIVENIKLLGIIGKSRDSYMVRLYEVAGVLSLLVVTAGILMISSTINSNLSKKTEFFGMLRCLGASKRQIKTFVILEALNWCKTAIPIGVVTGTLVSSILCALLRFLSPNYFSDMDAIAISILGIAAGCIVGIVTVILASISPANKASKVSPLTAVSGNAYSGYKKHSRLHLWLLPIEVKLGIKHSYNSKRNFILMVSSFALSIILFLSFSTGIDFLHHALKPLQPYSADISVYNENNTCEIDKAKVEEISKLSGIKSVYGRSFLYNIPSKLNGSSELKINLISYEEMQFKWAEKKIIEGNIESVMSQSKVMTVYDSKNPLKVNDVLTLQTDSGNKEVTIGAVITDSPFHSDDGTLNIIASEETFKEVSGNPNYTIIDVQLKSNSPQETVDKIHSLFEENYTFSDKRDDNSNARGAYLSMSVFMYGFVGIIGLITIFQIINSIAMSANARIHEYGTMRAIGTSVIQLTRMITAESITYGVFGMITGSIIGLPLHKYLYTNIITSRWGDIWRVPTGELLIILIVITLSCILAIYRPIKEIKEMSVADTLTTF